MHVSKTSTMIQGFEDMMPFIGSQMEDDLIKLKIPSARESAMRGRGIVHWQFDMQSRHLPLAILEERRHTDPAAYPVQHRSGPYSYQRIG